MVLSDKGFCIMIDFQNMKSITIKYPKEYRAFMDMSARCYRRKAKAYKFVKVCDLWRTSTFDGLGDFRNFMSYLGPAPDHWHDLDRIDPAGNYEHGNVRWIHTTENKSRKRPSADSYYNMTKASFHAHMEWLKKEGIEPRIPTDSEWLYYYRHEYASETGVS